MGDKEVKKKKKKPKVAAAAGSPAASATPTKKHAKPTKTKTKKKKSKHHKKSASSDSTLKRLGGALRNMFGKKGASGSSNVSDLFAEPVPEDHVPVLVDRCIAYLEEHGLETEGIFRVPPHFGEVNVLLESFTRDQVDIPPGTSPHVVAGMLKMFFREIPEPVMTYDFYSSFISAQKNQDIVTRLACFQELFAELPHGNLETLRRLLGLMCKIHARASVNLMTASNLAVTFAPSVLRRANATLDQMLLDTSHCSGVLETMIENFGFLFGDADDGADGAGMARRGSGGRGGAGGGVGGVGGGGVGGAGGEGADPMGPGGKYARLFRTNSTVRRRRSWDSQRRPSLLHEFYDTKPTASVSVTAAEAPRAAAAAAAAPSPALPGVPEDAAGGMSLLKSAVSRSSQGTWAVGRRRGHRRAASSFTPALYHTPEMSGGEESHRRSVSVGWEAELLRRFPEVSLAHGARGDKTKKSKGGKGEGKKKKKKKKKKHALAAGKANTPSSSASGKSAVSKKQKSAAKKKRKAQPLPPGMPSISESGHGTEEGSSSDDESSDGGASGDEGSDGSDWEDAESGDEVEVEVDVDMDRKRLMQLHYLARRVSMRRDEPTE